MIDFNSQKTNVYGLVCNQALTGLSKFCTDSPTNVVASFEPRDPIIVGLDNTFTNV